jgi:hypothetical protein
MDYSSLPTNEKVDDAVVKYCDTIVAYMLGLDPTLEYDVDKDYAADDKKTQKASIIDIQSPYGFITVFPDFSKKRAVAALLNRGMIRAMEIEGFDDDVINSSPVYGTLMPFTTENAEMFAVILTRDLELQHQKLLDE